jgi:hypothetical protein
LKIQAASRSERNSDLHINNKRKKANIGNNETYVSYQLQLRPKKKTSDTRPIIFLMNIDAELIKFVTMCVVTIDFVSNSGVLILVSLWNTICKLQIGTLAPPKKFSLKLHASRNLLAIEIFSKVSIIVLGENL